MNKVMLIGRICNDLKKKYIGDSTKICSSVFGSAKTFQKILKMSMIQISFNANCGTQCGFSCENFAKGDMVAFEGAIRNNNYEKDGVKHYSNKIVVESKYFHRKYTDEEKQ